MQPTRADILLQDLGTLAQNPTVTSVVTDNRNAKQGSLFVCIPGERVDGHDFAAQAVQSGAVGIVAQHAVKDVPTEKTVLASDTLDAMIALGGNYRTQFAPTLVGVTGSVGKTTTKEFCYAVFSAFGETIKTEGNQNNEIGMPNTLLRIADTTQYAVIEMGMQGLGEIAKLTHAAKPMGGIITCIGVSHLEQLGSRENILRAKMELCEGLADGAPLVLNGDDDLLPHAKIPPHVKAVFFGIDSANAEVCASNIIAKEGGTAFTLQDKQHGVFSVTIPALGKHNVRNALAAYTLATRLGLDAKKCASALARYETTGHRQNMRSHGGVTVIEDCYNASPDSMRAALQTLRDFPAKGRRVAVLGDMFELGSITQSAHEELGSLAAAANVQLLITVGEATRATYTKAKALGVSAAHCACKEDAVAVLRNFCDAGDIVLVKASHGMAFETILEGFYAEETGE